MKIILGSQSTSRRELLGRIVPEFEVMSADIDEKAVRSDDYELLPLLLARAKAQALLPKVRQDALLITCDQVIVCNGELREKPESKEQAYEYLRSYAHHPAETITAVVVTNTTNGRRLEDIDVAKVYFQAIPEEVVEQLVEAGGVMSAAGGFRIEDPILMKYSERVEGAVESVMGLPLEMTTTLLELARGGESVRPPVLEHFGLNFRCDKPKLWALDLLVEEVPLARLLWHFNLPCWHFEKNGEWGLTPWELIERPEAEPNHWRRVQESDTSFALDVFMHSGRLVRLDGLHRLVKLYLDGAKNIKVRVVPAEKLKDCVREI